MKIAFLCRSLSGGGAERQLELLARGLLERGHAVRIFAFYEAPEIRTLVPVFALGKQGRWDVVSFFWRLLRALRQERPDVLHAYLPMANVLALLAKPALPHTRIVIGVRASNMDLSRYDRLAALAYRLEGWLARCADLIIANSAAARRQVIATGYPVNRVLAIANGIDADAFRPDPHGRERLRAAWNVPAGATLLGTAGRLDPMKGHDVFLAAAASLAADHPGLRVVVVGDGPKDDYARLTARAHALGIAERVVLAGHRSDLNACYSAMDVFVMPSIFGEGFPNVVGEAMACEVPCVVTDVGDAAEIVNGSGGVAKPDDASSLAAAIHEMLARSPQARQALGRAARQRVIERYGVSRLVERTEQALADIAQTI